MKKCIFILPYFGVFKNYFNLFLKSCTKNPEYNWLIITNDHTAYNYPANVYVKYMEFSEFKNIIQLKFEFEIELNKPYKLNDYKPAYGYILEEWIQGYEYWGYCDCDLLFGNLQNFLSPLLEKKYEKLFAAGHLTIYRNSYENNRRFMLPYKGEKIYRKVFTSDGQFNFDEHFYEKNINAIYVEHGFPLYTDDLSFNCSTKYYNIAREYYNERKWIIQPIEPLTLYWEDGEVKSITFDRKKGCLEYKNYLYVHLQGRDMGVDSSIENSNCIRIEPARFTSGFEYPKTLNEWKRQRKIYLSFRIIRKFIRRTHVKARLLRIARVFKFKKSKLIGNYPSI